MQYFSHGRNNGPQLHREKRFQMETFTECPGSKVYTDAAGHQREVYPNLSKFDGTWFYVYSLASCTDECTRCNSSEQDDYCGERWDEDY